MRNGIVIHALIIVYPGWTKRGVMGVEEICRVGGLLSGNCIFGLSTIDEVIWQMNTQWSCIVLSSIKPRQLHTCLDAPYMTGGKIELASRRRRSAQCSKRFKGWCTAFGQDLGIPRKHVGEMILWIGTLRRRACCRGMQADQLFGQFSAQLSLKFCTKRDLE